MITLCEHCRMIFAPELTVGVIVVNSKDNAGLEGIVCTNCWKTLFGNMKDFLNKGEDDD